MRISIWLIDLDGTLYCATPVRLAMALELAVFSPSSIPTIRAFRRAHEDLRAHSLEPGVTPYDLQIARAARRLAVRSDEVRRITSRWMIERPGKWLRLFRRRWLLQEIERFRARGGRTGLVSDYPAELKLSALGIRHLFDTVVANGEPGGPVRLKPHPDGYLQAARQLETPPEMCLVLGDRMDTDGEAARRAGMMFVNVTAKLRTPLGDYSAIGTKDWQAGRIAAEPQGCSRFQ